MTEVIEASPKKHTATAPLLKSNYLKGGSRQVRDLGYVYQQLQSPFVYERISKLPMNQHRSYQL